MNDERPRPDPVNWLLAVLIAVVVLAVLAFVVLSGDFIPDQP